ncbi:MAG: hypothetical protein ISR82_03075 [Candidatus Marinimicrobia bacterium]|nr:hypothetical protein [Candidatus Neomarinimicrobiota bacterium]MBL7010185.1 hypothetical protein [Candidatus Neomarinimicrobiota bacterium]MBL7030598.1 hypothetical protein [Candidatus Neomarinimicrobiota bacterium]
MIYKRDKYQYFLLIILFTGTLWAIPRYALENGSSCILCHIDPSGGGLRNDYGIAYGMDDLAGKVPQKFSSYSGIVLNHIQIGGDVRFQSVTKSKGKAPDGLAFFPMQANIQFKTEWKNYVAKLELATLQEDGGFQLRFNKKSGYVKAGVGKPSFGMKLPDHTVFTRGGNIKLVNGDHREGMPFIPTLKNAPLLEIGQYWRDIHYSFGSTKGYFYDKSKSFYGRIEYYFSSGSLNKMIGASFLRETKALDGLQMLNLNGGISQGKFSWMGEATIAENLVIGRSIASYSELTWMIKKGLNISGRIDFFDESMIYTEDAIRRTTFGLNYVPLPFVDIKFQIRSTQLWGGVPSKGMEILSQIHLWF